MDINHLSSWEKKLWDAKDYLGGLPDQLAAEIGHHVIGIPFNNPEGTGRQSCNDPFSIFSFLAFALAVANFLMDMNDMRRRKRSLDGCHSSSSRDHLTEDAVLASYSIVRSALNSVGAEEECSKRFMCEGGREARKYGKVGILVGDGALELLGKEKREHIINGLSGSHCGKLYRGCRDYPNHYRNPSVDLEEDRNGTERHREERSLREGSYEVTDDTSSILPVEDLIRELLQTADISAILNPKHSQ